MSKPFVSGAELKLENEVFDTFRMDLREEGPEENHDDYDY